MLRTKDVDTQQMRALLSNGELLKRKLIGIENHVR